MARIKDKKSGLRTVGDVINALNAFPADMPVGSGLERSIKIYRESPESDEETYSDSRGQITIEGDEDF